MLSDEEKQAIERLNIYKEKIKDELYPIIDFEEEKAIGVVLNLIEKQSKEIEELKEKNEHITKETVDFVNTHYISKDEIKAEIEDILNSENSEAIEKLIEWQSLLEKE